MHGERKEVFKGGDSKGLGGDEGDFSFYGVSPGGFNSSRVGSCLYGQVAGGEVGGERGGV